MLAYRAMKRLVLALFACTVNHASASGDRPDVPPFSLTIDPKQMHEECVRLEAGAKRRYHWKSDSPVDFNVHYHEGPEVFYPVKRDGMRGDGGTFVAKSAEEFCWMWTARNAAAKVEGQVSSERP